MTWIAGDPASTLTGTPARVSGIEGSAGRHRFSYRFELESEAARA
jgi:hypothetical protein